MHKMPQQTQFELPNTADQIDTISMGEGGVLMGTITHWTLDAQGVPQLQHTPFEADAKKRLSPFSYKKPMVDGDVFHPQEKWEEGQREGYVPLVVVRNSYRGPNHWHREDSAIACAVLVNDVWETRFFPKKNIPDETWEEVMALLKE